MKLIGHDMTYFNQNRYFLDGSTVFGRHDDLKTWLPPKWLNRISNVFQTFPNYNLRNIFPYFHASEKEILKHGCLNNGNCNLRLNFIIIFKFTTFDDFLPFWMNHNYFTGQEKCFANSQLFPIFPNQREP